MSCDNIFKDICHIHARLFDHRSAFQGHINYFVKEFEDKRGDREKARLDHMQETLTQSKDHTLPNIHSNFAEQLSAISSRINQASEDCKALSELLNEEKPDSELLQSQRAARQHALDQFMEQQCVRSTLVDQNFSDNVKLFNTHFEELQTQLNQGIPFNSQTYYKFMALGKELS